MRLKQCVALSLVVFTCAHVRAQLPPSQKLGQVGRNATQTISGDAVQTACGALAKAGGGSLSNSLSRDLFFRCNEMVGNVQKTPTGRSLNQGSTQLGSTLQQVSVEEITSPGTLAAEDVSLQASQIISRLGALRAGVRSGVLAGAAAPLAVKALVGAYVEPDSRGGAAGDSGSGRFGVFLTGKYGWGDREATNNLNEAPFDFDGGEVVAGFDYRFTDNVWGGMALGGASSKAEFTQTPLGEVTGGEVSGDGILWSLYGTYSKENLYVDGVFTFGQHWLKSEREIQYEAFNANGSVIPAGCNPFGGAVCSINRTATGKPDANEFRFDLGSGYNFNRGSFGFGPYGRMDYLHIDIDSFTETGALGLNLNVDSQDIDSLITALGVQGTYAWSRSFGVLIPYGRVEWNHEFLNDSRTVSARYANEFVATGTITNFLVATGSPDRDFGTFGVGIQGVFKRGIQGFVEYERVFGLSNFTGNQVTAGLRIEIP